MTAPGRPNCSSSEDIALQPLRTASPTGNLATDVSPGAASPSETSETVATTAVPSNAALSSEDRAFLRWLKRRMWTAYARNQIQKLGRTLPQSQEGKWTIVVAVYGAIFLLYEYIHIKKPSLVTAIDQSLAAQATAAATAWDQYQTWVMKICPLEILRNITTTDACKKAMNESIPPPPKPQHFQRASLGQGIARQFLPYVNASRAFKADMLVTLESCRSGISSRHQPSSCSDVDISKFFHHKPISTIEPPQAPNFPLPSSQGIHIWYSTLGLPMATVAWISVIVMLLISLLNLKLALSWLYRRRLKRAFRVVIDWRPVLYGVSFYLTVIICWSTWQLTQFMAKDAFLASCMKHKTIAKEMSLECRDLFTASNTLSPETEIKVWSIWQGYLFARMSQFSTDDFVLISMLLALIWTLWQMRSTQALKSSGMQFSVRGTGNYTAISTDGQDVETGFKAPPDKKN